MTILLGLLLAFVAGSMLLLGFGFLFAEDLRKNGARLMLGSVFIAGVSIYMFNSSAEIAATQLGFRSLSDQNEAKKAGFEDASAWKQEQQRQAAASQAAAERTRLAREQEQRASIAKAAADAESEIKLCRENIQCIGDKMHIDATSACRRYVENMARNDFQWIDGWTESKFSRFRFKNISMKIITYIGDKVQYQNGMGNWVRHIYECDFNIDTKNVEDVRAKPGRLPS